MQRQEPERKRNKNFAGLWQSCFLLHGVDERENDDLDSIGQTQPMRTNVAGTMGSLGLGRLT